MRHELVALLRLAELGVRRSPAARRLARALLACSARRVRVVRELVRLRVMRTV